MEARPRAPSLGWLPPFLVGASAAVAAEVAISILLYGGPGLVRSLTTVLTVEALAIAGGLAIAPTGGPDLVDRIRRHWLFCLVGFLGAAVYGTVWTLLPWVGGGRLGQGVGLAVLGAVPMYSAGTVLGGMAAAARTDAGGRLRRPAPAAALGAAFGFVVTGFLLPRALLPASLLIACLVMLSLGGLVFGAVLAARTEVELVARRPGIGGEVRVEERRRPVDDLAEVVLMQGSFVRRVMDVDGGSVAPWDVEVARFLMPDLEGQWRVFFIGGGCSSAPHAVLREHPTAEVHVMEHAAAVVELGRDHFDTRLVGGGGDRIEVSMGNLDDAVERLLGPVAAVIVDTDALAAVGGARALSRRTWEGLARLVIHGGFVAWGPDSNAVEAKVEGWPRISLRRSIAGRDESIVIARRAEATCPWPEVPRGFVAAEERADQAPGIALGVAAP